MIRLSLMILMTSALIFGSANAQYLSLDDYLDRVRSTHPFFVKEAMATDIEEKKREGLLGAEDWLLVSSPSFTHQEPLQQGPFDPERIDVLSLGAGVGRTFWGNGSRLILSWASDVSDQKIPGFSIPVPGGVIDVPIGPSTYYRHQLSATYSLPLLKNRHGVLDRLEYELSAFDVDLSGINALENQENFLLELGLKFLDWVLLEEQLRIARDRLSLAEEELDRSKRKREANLIDEVDVRRAEEAVYVVKSAVFLIVSRWKATQAELATLAGSHDLYGLTPQFDLYDRPAVGSAETIMEELKKTSRLIRSLEIQLSQLGRMEEGLIEDVRPELSLNLRGSLLGGDEDFANSLDVTQPDVTVGVELRYPFGNRTARANVDGARLRSRQLTKAIEEVELTLEAGLRNILVQTNELENVLANNVAQIETAKQRTEEELRLYNQGRGDLTFVIQSRDGEASAKLSYAENSAVYHTLVFQYRALTDRLLR
jgi:outer membrane protein TolC